MAFLGTIAKLAIDGQSTAKSNPAMGGLRAGSFESIVLAMGSINKSGNIGTSNLSVTLTDLAGFIIEGPIYIWHFLIFLSWNITTSRDGIGQTNSRDGGFTLSRDGIGVDITR